jgi:hypothetical protein
LQNPKGKKMRSFLLAMSLATIFPGGVDAQGLQAVRPLPSYTCMMLAAPPAETVQAIPRIAVRQAPFSSAPILSWAPTVVLVSEPVVLQGGFLKATFADHHTGWIQATELKPWSTPYNPSRRCIPSTMSNGSFGFDFR